jgi:hypothetical protein
MALLKKKDPPPAPERPEVFHWNMAIEYANSIGHGRTAVIGLSMISCQLDRIIELLEDGKK